MGGKDAQSGARAWRRTGKMDRGGCLGRGEQRGEDNPGGKGKKKKTNKQKRRMKGEIKEKSEPTKIID